MILYLCSEENYDLLDFSENFPVKKLLGNRSLKKFVINEARNFSAYSYLIVDLNSLTDTEDEIVDAIMGFRAMYDARIIVLANEKDELLSKLYDAGVRHFITDTDPHKIQEEILNCISKNGSDSCKNKKDIKLNSFTDSNSFNANENIAKDHKNDCGSTKKSKVIAVAGTANNVGTTTTACNLAHFLTNIGKVSYICSSLSSLFSDIENKSSDVFLEYKGVNCFSKDGNLDLAEYDFVILDLNVLDSSCVTPFLNADIRILCSTVMRHDLDRLPELLKLVAGHATNFIFSFVPPGAQEQAYKLVDGNQVYFSEFSTNLFDGNANKAIWHKIMNINEPVKTADERISTNNVKLAKTTKVYSEDLHEKPESDMFEKIKQTSEGLKNSLQIPQIIPNFRKSKTSNLSNISRVIAVGGAAHGLGCTHNALAIAFFFSNLKYKVALVELGKSNDLLILGGSLEAEQQNEICYRINGFDVFPRGLGEPSVKPEIVIKSGYDVVIFDLGVLRPDDFSNNAYYEMNRADISVLAASSALWRWKDLRPFFENAETAHWNILVAGNTNCEELRKCIENTVYCVPWADAFAISAARDRVFESLFEPLLIQMKIAKKGQGPPATSNYIKRDPEFLNLNSETVMINLDAVDKATTPAEFRKLTS